MITFETLEDFENAVMEVLRDRLEVGVSVSEGYYDYSETKVTKVEVTLRDSENYSPISTAKDNA